MIETNYRTRTGPRGMTYQDYADFHLVPRAAAPVDECEAMRLPRLRRDP